MNCIPDKSDFDYPFEKFHANLYGRKQTIGNPFEFRLKSTFEIEADYKNSVQENSSSVEFKVERLRLKLGGEFWRRKNGGLIFMFCSKCGNPNSEGVSFCRNCGTDLENSSLASVKQNSLHQKNTDRTLTQAQSKDPDELTGKGIGSVIVGDGFFMVAIILSATTSSVSSLLWLFLLIPAFFFFGKGFADVLHARQIRRRLKRNELTGAPQIAELPPSRVSFIETIKKHTSGELVPVPSVTDATTRDLK